MASREIPPSNPISAIPDLDIALPSKRPPGGAQRAEVNDHPIAAASPAYGLEGILDDDLLASDFDASALDIDLPDSARQKRVEPLAATTGAWPDGKTPEPGSVEIAPSQIEPLCPWGERPTRWWETIIYAFQVYRGKLQIRDQIAPISRELTQAETRRDECLAQLAMTHKDSLERAGTFRTALEAAEAALGQQQQLAAQQRSTQTHLTSETWALDQALTLAEAEIEELNGRATTLTSKTEDAQIAFRREQARLQRLGIERRNIEQANPPGSPALAQLDELEVQANALGPQIELAQETVNSAKAALDETNATIEEKIAQIRELKHRKDLLGRSLASQMRQVTVAVDSARDRQTTVLADLGRAILAARGRIAVNDTTLQQVARHDDEVATIWRRQQVYVSALAHFDKSAVRRGTRLTITFSAVIVIALAWRLLR